MADGRRLSHILSIAVCAGALLAGAIPAAAQSNTQEIVVEAPRVVHQKVGRNSNGAYEELVSLSHRVTYSDLDLRKTADIATLRTRVRDAAQLGCSQLEKMYPLEQHDPACVKKAMDRAAKQLRAALHVR